MLFSSVSAPTGGISIEVAILPTLLDVAAQVLFFFLITVEFAHYKPHNPCHNQEKHEHETCPKTDQKRHKLPTFRQIIHFFLPFLVVLS